MNTSTKSITKSLLLTSLLSAGLLAGCNSDDHNKNAVNKAPKVDDIMLTTETETAVMAKITARDGDGDVLGFTLNQQPTLGMVSLTPNGEFTYTPNTEVTGTDSFTIAVTDGINDSVNATVMVTIEAQQLQFSSLSRQAFSQDANDEPLRLNGRDVSNDVSEANFYDDLLLD
ncbi:Ig-like domain-containing protein [Shewanella sp. MF05960]|uniref:Ig-like domain-containing protein n=1 Tax=Shewanella sp. MF05960 TaxID=3434874 RepID=UPI003D792155